jgi:hypothetical protein
MATLSVQTNVTIDDFVEAAEQLQTAELAKLARRLLQIHARRKAPNLPQREAELLEAIAQSGSFEQQARYHQLSGELERRALTFTLHVPFARTRRQTPEDPCGVGPKLKGTTAASRFRE